MKFTDMSIDEFKKDFKKFLKQFSRKEIIEILSKYAKNKTKESNK